jgi:hypothetical protein
MAMRIPTALLFSHVLRTALQLLLPRIHTRSQLRRQILTLKITTNLQIWVPSDHLRELRHINKPDSSTGCQVDRELVAVAYHLGRVQIEGRLLQIAVRHRPTVVDMGLRSMAVGADMAPIDTMALPAIEQVQIPVPNTDQVDMEDWEGRTVMRQPQQKTNEMHYSVVRRIGTHSGALCHPATDGLEEVTLLSLAQLVAKVATAPMGKTDSLRPRKKRKKM